MTDPTPEDRAEQAFRTAFTRYADDLEPGSLSVTPRRRRWPAVVAAAAAVAVLVSVTVAVTGDRDRDEDVAAPGPSSTSTSTPDSPPYTGPLRNVTYRGVSVDVPADWVDDFIPSGGQCGYAPDPFVATAQPGIARTLALCIPPTPVPTPPQGFPGSAPATWVPNVQLQDATGFGERLPDGTQTYEGWTLTRRTVGDVVVQTLVEADSAAAADQVQGSAREVEVDGNGCRSTSPVQEAAAVRPAAFDVTQVRATSITVCLYGRGNPDEPGLIASRRIDDGEAQDVLAAIQAAPAGGGPDRPRNCLREDLGELALSVRLDDGDTPGPELYVTFQSCHDNGIDDGTTLRTLTTASCRPLFGDRVTYPGGSAATFRICYPVPD